MANLVAIYNKMKHDISVLEKDGIRASFQCSPILSSLDSIAKNNNGEADEITLFRRGLDLLRNTIESVKNEYKASRKLADDKEYEEEDYE